MSLGLHIRENAELDFLSLGALVHRLDPGVIPFRKATECHIHVSGGEFNVAANLADCFGLKTASRRQCPTIQLATSSTSACARWVSSLSTSTLSTMASPARTCHCL